MLISSMGLSKKLKSKIEQLSVEQRKKLVKMSIEDKVSFKEINNKFQLSPGEVEKFLLRELGEQRFKRWKLRQQKRSTLKGRPKQDF